MTWKISSHTRKLLEASKLRGCGRAMLLTLRRDPLFFRAALEDLGDLQPALASSLGPQAIESARLKAQRDIDEASQRGHRIVSPLDTADYPELCNGLSDAPALLFVAGAPKLFSAKAVSVIGTREPSRHGILTTQRVTSYFAQRGWQIVSGLALGVDETAHAQAVLDGASTIAVLAHGLDSVYPKSNERLADAILENGGGLISEYPYGTRPFSSNFIERDRIQAAMALGVVMVQSALKGGSLHASKAALRYGRTLAIPMPTQEDRQAAHPKIEANLWLHKANEQERATFLDCSTSQAAKITFLHSREDFPALEAILLGESTSEIRPDTQSAVVQGGAEQ